MDNSTKISLYNVPKFEKALVVNRPSKKIKSPYLADIKLYDSENNLIDEEYLAHSPTLGCNGLISSNSIVYVVKNDGEKRKSKYTIFNVKIKDPEIIIGVHPMAANDIFEKLLRNNILDEFSGAKNIKREYKVLKSRIDFHFELGDTKIFLEIKNVPIANYVNADTENKKVTPDFSSYNKYEKIALFPLGYRSKKEDLISPRAFKHIEDLMELQKEPGNQSYLIYITQRGDVEYFSPCTIDKLYYDKVYEAIAAGVKVIPIKVKWDGENVYFDKILELLPYKEI
jgi:DNA-binding sugar fermentation-stimulating protein